MKLVNTFTLKTALMTIALTLALVACAAVWAVAEEQGSAAAAPAGGEADTPAGAREADIEDTKQPEPGDWHPRRTMRDGRPDPADIEERIRRWQEMRPEARALLLERLEQFDGMPEEIRERLKARLAEWQEMPSEQKRRIHERLQEIHRRMSDRRADMRRRSIELRRMPPERRDSLDRAVKVMRDLPSETREELMALPPHERRARLREILESHGVLPPGSPGKHPHAPPPWIPREPGERDIPRPWGSPHREQYIREPSPVEEPDAPAAGVEGDTLVDNGEAAD